MPSPTLPPSFVPQVNGVTAVYFGLFYALMETVKWYVGEKSKAKRAKQVVDEKSLTEVNRLAGWQDSLTKQLMERVEKIETKYDEREKDHQEIIDMLTVRHRDEVKQLEDELAAARGQLRDSLSMLATCNATIAQLTQRVAELERENLTQQRKLLESSSPESSH